MTKKFRLKLIATALVLMSTVSFSQTSTETAKEEDEFAKKKPETKLMEVIPTDSLPASELVKRAVFWMKQESLKYKKTNATTTGNKVECMASFPVKPKELNPEVDYTGKITMKVVIECKDSKYRYTVSEIKHISKSGNTNGGNIDNVVPECGSMGMNEITWKKLKGQALTISAEVALDIKAGMAQEPTEAKEDEW